MKVSPRIHRAVAGALLTLGAAACATNGQTIEPGALVGCWYFEQDASASGARLPWGVRLVAEPVEGWPALETREDVRVAETLTTSGARDFPIGYWRPTAAGDSLELGHPAGGGLVVHVSVPGAGAGERVLSGTARPVGDAVRLGGQASASEPRDVRLTRARCP